MNLNIKIYKKKKYLIYNPSLFTSYNVYPLKYKPLQNFSWIYLQLAMHKRQQYFIWYKGQTNAPIKPTVYSAGLFLKQICQKLKYYKKSRANIGHLVIKFRLKLNMQAHFIKLLHCKNFNFRQYLWLKKYLISAKPHIKYSILTNSWSFSPKGKKRIKKRVYKNLMKLII